MSIDEALLRRKISSEHIENLSYGVKILLFGHRILCVFIKYFDFIIITDYYISFFDRTNSPFEFTLNILASKFEFLNKIWPLF